jgi:5-methylcytosine-specific restriction endonuclease McrA
MKPGQFIRKGHQFIKEYDLCKIEQKKDHRRFKVFYHKGCTCVTCGIVGTRVIETGQINKRGFVISFHIDLYTEDLQLITVDHIHPKSKGGGNELENLQPMCENCNSKKGAATLLPQETVCTT